jgi:hypothetical protein
MMGSSGPSPSPRPLQAHSAAKTTNTLATRAKDISMHSRNGAPGSQGPGEADSTPSGAWGVSHDPPALQSSSGSSVSPIESESFALAPGVK